MKDVQILGLIVTLVAIVCGTILLWKRIDSKREVEREKNAANRASHDKVFDDNTWAMYEAEKLTRQQAETREGILRVQLKREKEKTLRLEQFLKDCKVNDIEKVIAS